MLTLTDSQKLERIQEILNQGKKEETATTVKVEDLENLGFYPKFEKGKLVGMTVGFKEEPKKRKPRSPESIEKMKATIAKKKEAANK